MKLKVKQGVTSKLVRFFVSDSTATDGRGKTGIAYNASGLSAYYIGEGDSTPTQITLASGAVGVWSSGGWSEVSASYLPGVYEVGLPDAAIDATSNSVVVMLKGATDMAPVLIEVQLVAIDESNATTLGLTNLDAAISSRSTFDHSSNQVTTDSASRTAAQADVSALATASEVASIDALVDEIKSVTDNLPNSGALTDIATAAAVVTIDSVADSILVIANKLDSAMEADGLVSRFTTNALEQAPSSSGGDATASNQSAIITHLTDIKGSGFASTDTLEAIRDRGDSAWTTGGSGSGIYSLTVTCQDSSGSAVANVRVNIDGTTTTLVTNSSGQCVFNLDAGDYSLVASPPSEFNTPADTAVTVSADGSQTITLTQASTSGSAGWVG